MKIRLTIPSNSSQRAAVKDDCKPTITQQKTSPPILEEEVEAIVRSLKPSKSPRVDNVPFELVKNGKVAKAPIARCQ